MSCGRASGFRLAAMLRVSTISGGTTSAFFLAALLYVRTASALCLAAFRRAAILRVITMPCAAERQWCHRWRMLMRDREDSDLNKSFC